MNTVRIIPLGSMLWVPVLIGGLGQLDLHADDQATATEHIAFTETGGGIGAVAFSADGRRALTGSRDAIVRVWDLATGKILHRFRGHKRYVRAAAISRDGKRAMTGSIDNSVILWDLETGKEIKRLSGHTSDISGVQFSSDGHKALTFDWKRNVFLWDLKTGRAIQREKMWGRLESIGLSSNGKEMLVGNTSGWIHRYKTQTGEPLGKVGRHKSYVYAVAWSPDGKRALSGSKDQTARIWDLKTGKELRVLKGHKFWVRAVAWSPDGRYVATGGDDATLRVWNVETGRSVQISGDGHHIMSVAFSANGEFVFSGTRKGVTRWRFQDRVAANVDQTATSLWAIGWSWSIGSPQPEFRRRHRSSVLANAQNVRDTIP